MTRVVPEAGDACEPGDETGVLAGWDRWRLGRRSVDHHAWNESQNKRLRRPESFAPTVDELAMSLGAQGHRQRRRPRGAHAEATQASSGARAGGERLVPLRGAVDLTVNMLSISRYSVYKYLKELQVDTRREIGLPGSRETQRATATPLLRLEPHRRTRGAD